MIFNRARWNALQCQESSIVLPNTYCLNTTIKLKSTLWCSLSGHPFVCSGATSDVTRAVNLKYLSKLRSVLAIHVSDVELDLQCSLRCHCRMSYFWSQLPVLWPDSDNPLPKLAILPSHRISAGSDDRHVMQEMCRPGSAHEGCGHQNDLPCRLPSSLGHTGYRLGQVAKVLWHPPEET